MQSVVPVAEVPRYNNTATGATPYPDNEWFQFLRTGSTGVLELANLQAEASIVGAPNLNTSLPGGITTGLKLVSNVTGDREYAAIFWPGAGMFGVRSGRVVVACVVVWKGVFVVCGQTRGLRCYHVLAGLTGLL